MDNKLAQTETPLGDPLTGLGWLGSGNPAEAPSLFNQVFSIIVGVLTMIASIWFLFLTITGALGWMSAGGDKAAIENAKKKIQNGLIGLIIVISAIFLADIVGTIFGFPYITNPAEFIQSIAPVPPTSTPP